MGCAQSVHDTEAAARQPSARSSAPAAPPHKLTAQQLGDQLYEKALAAVYANKALPPGGPPSAELEGRRIQALHALHALEPSELDARLNTIVELIQSTFQVDYAALSLIDADYQIFKVKAGWPLDATDRQTAFGSWALASEHAKMLVVEDTLADARFKRNPLVTSPRTALRFYAGAPLMSSDRSGAYGMLLIGDRAPRRFAVEQLAILSNFAELCARKLESAAPGRLLELRAKAAAAQAGAAPKLERDLSAFSEAVIMVDCETDAWLLRWGDTQFEALADVTVSSAMGKDLWSLFRVAGADHEEAMIEASAAIFCQKPFSLTVTRAGGGGPLPQERLVLQFRPAALGLRGSGIPEIAIPAHVASIAAEGGACEALAVDLRHCWFATLSKEASPAAAGGGTAPAGGTGMRRNKPAVPAELAPVSPRAGGSFSVLRSGHSFARGGGSPHLTRSLSFTIDDKRSWEQVFKDAKLGPLLGSGSYGRVYRGQWRGTEVAVKVMDYYAPADGSAFELTAEKHSALLEALVGRNFAHHPNLVQTYSLGLRPLDSLDPSAPPDTPVRHTLWIVLQLCNCGALQEAILKGRFRDSPAPDSSPNMLSILQTAQEIAGGMSLLHDAGIIHGDLSANNVLLNAAANRRRFTAAVSDFGLARMCADHSGKHTETVGTVTHQPPELLREGLLTSAADVWAFGVLLWSMYTGEQPFSGQHPVAIITQVSALPRCPLELPADAPAGFRELFERCTSYEREARPTFHEILDALAPMVEAAEAEAPPSPQRGRLARSRNDALASQPSLPLRAGSLPLPAAVLEGSPVADVLASAAADEPAAAGRPPPARLGERPLRRALAKCRARPDSPYEPLERAIQVINRVIALGEKAKWGSGEQGPQDGSSSSGSGSNPGQERWVQFAAVYNSSLGVGSSNDGSGTSTRSSGGSSSDSSGRQLRDYLALPIEQYSLLDPKWISREEGSLFRFSVPLQDLVGVDLQPEIYFSVLAEPEEARVTLSGARAALGSPEIDAAFRLNVTAVVSQRQRRRLPAMPDHLPGRPVMRLRRWAAAARGRAWPPPEGASGAAAAAAAAAAAGAAAAAEQQGNSNGSASSSEAGPEAAQAAAAADDDSSAVPFPGQHVYISHDENDSDEYDEADGELAAADLAAADLGEMSASWYGSSNGSGSSSGTNGSSGSSSGSGSGSSSGANGSSGSGSGSGTAVLSTQQTAVDAAGQQVQVQAGGQAGPRALLHCRTRVTMAVRVPGPLKVVPNALLGYAGSLLLRTILSATLPNFLALLAADYRRWAGIAGTGDSSARQLDAPVGELFSDAAAAVQEGRQRRQHQPAGDDEKAGQAQSEELLPTQGGPAAAAEGGEERAQPLS
ncbi:kinase [Chlorella sorokiniana]|uniref:Kinase n=1 Tax=Chlorella sorokiniana TaxID=3076 RepID=A0A2P6TVB2_CHLSO|nr:kinase [Chlorella sorokiniana]|eukprot:PRW58005.1 kinase [Chlorella sorokiniana]